MIYLSTWTEQNSPVGGGVLLTIHPLRSQGAYQNRIAGIDWLDFGTAHVQWEEQLDGQISSFLVTFSPISELCFVIG